MSSSNKSDKNNSTSEKTRARKSTKDKFWQIRVSEYLDDRLEQFMSGKGIKNKSDWIRNLVIMYMDMFSDNDFSKTKEWRNLVNQYIKSNSDISDTTDR